MCREGLDVSCLLPSGEVVFSLDDKRPLGWDGMGWGDISEVPPTPGKLVTISVGRYVA